MLARQKGGRKAAFVALTIVERHTKKISKLKGLLRLLDKGIDVRCAPLSYTLLVDYRPAPWTDLDVHGRS